MQNIYDMTTAEVATLTEEEIKSFIDIECASKGVMLLPPEPVKPVQPEIVQDITMYEFMGVHFKTSDAAAAVMREIAKHEQYTYDYKAGVKTFKPGTHYAANRVDVAQGMSNAFASALEISAKIIRDNLGDPVTTRRLISEKIQNMDHSDVRGSKENIYLRNMKEGYCAVLAGLYKVAHKEDAA